MHGVGSRNKLTPWHARFYAGDTPLDALGRALCAASCLPRKELHEAWEMGARVRARFAQTGAARVVDLCGGAGLLAQVLLLTEPAFACAVVVDRKLPPNHLRIHDALCAAYPQLTGRVRFEQARLEAFSLSRDDLIVSAHACGPLTDAVLARAADVGARVAVMPCCHHVRRRVDLAAAEDPARAMDLERVAALAARGYQAWLDAIPEAVSPKNTIVIGAPA